MLKTLIMQDSAPEGNSEILTYEGFYLKSLRQHLPEGF